MQAHDIYASAVIKNLNLYMETVFQKIEKEQPELLEKMQFLLHKKDSELIAQMSLGIKSKHIRIFIETGHEQHEVANIEYLTIPPIITN